MLTLKQKTNKLKKYSSQNENVGMGTIIIPDISGFSRLVHGTDIRTGKLIAKELLSSIINSNVLGLKISEIEGDAVLFYRCDYKVIEEELLGQYELMLKSFMATLKRINNIYGLDLDLSLKMIAHYGELSEYSINGFKKLYGEAVVEAHELLKNKIKSESYVLVTEELLSQNPVHQQLDSSYHKKYLDDENQSGYLTYFEYDKYQWTTIKK